jgi:hypothetical protein
MQLCAQRSCIQCPAFLLQGSDKSEVYIDFCSEAMLWVPEMHINVTARGYVPWRESAI